MTTNEIFLGKKITVNYRLKRVTKFSEFNEHGRRRRLKIWEPRLTEILDVIVVGKRTLSNGTTYYEEGYGNIYEPKEYFTALLVVRTLKESPFYINYPK